MQHICFRISAKCFGIPQRVHHKAAKNNEKEIVYINPLGHVGL